jgi:chromosome partitioning protein
VTEESIVDAIDSAEREAAFVIVDLEGTASLLVANTIGMADLVVIPTQGSSMDAKGAAKTIRLIRNSERLSRRRIAHAVLLTRTGAAVTSRALRNVQEQLQAGGIERFETAVVERAAFKDLFDFGGTLSGLAAAQTSNLEKAIQDAREFAGEVVSKLEAASARSAACWSARNALLSASATNLMTSIRPPGPNQSPGMTSLHPR